MRVVGIDTSPFLYTNYTYAFDAAPVPYRVAHKKG